jgi:hypothetical protein
MTRLKIWMRLAGAWLVLAMCPLAQAAYVSNGDGTVTDTTTGFMWQQEDARNDGGGFTWNDALAYCEELSLGGFNDWRLPNYRELASLVDDSRFDPAIDPVFQCRSGPYHTSTNSADSPSLTWYMEFQVGHSIGLSVKPATLYVRCMRAGTGQSLPEVSICTPNAWASEPGRNKGWFVITRTRDTSKALTVYCKVAGTARNGVDYKKLPGKLTIPIGKVSASCYIKPMDDSTKERKETVKVTLVIKPSCQIGTPPSATVTIADND